MPNATNDELFEAFMAGFGAAGEGFNRDYLPKQYWGEDGEAALRARLRGEFDARYPTPLDDA